MGEMERAIDGGQPDLWKRRWFRGLVAVELVAVMLTGVSAVALFGPAPVADAEQYSPAMLMRDFTVVVSGDADLQHGASGGEIAGSLAVGGNLSFGTYQLVAPTQPGVALPAVDGPGVQLLVGGAVAIDSGSARLDVNAGRVRIADTTEMTVSADRRLYRTDQSRYVRNQSAASQSSVGDPENPTSYTATAGAFGRSFAASFDAFPDISASLAALTPADGAAMVTPVNDGGKWAITLVPGTVNVLATDAAQLASVSEVHFTGGLLPNVTTPLIINVSSAAGTSIKSPRFNGGTAHNAQYMLWNFSGWNSLRLVAGGSEMSGGILAPNADVLYERTVLFEGQIAARSIVIRGSAEIHHWGFLSDIITTPSPTPTPTPTTTPDPDPDPASGVVTFVDETCETIGGAQFVVDPGEHVTYTLTVGSVTAPVEPGTYAPDEYGVAYVIRAIADDGYELEPPGVWTHTFERAVDCLPTHPLAYGLFSASHKTCAGGTNTFSVIDVPGIRYTSTVNGLTTEIRTGLHDDVELDVEYTITAAAEEGYGLDTNYPSRWVVQFSDPDCAGLAFTGVSPWLLVLAGSGSLAVLLGVVILVMLRRHRPGRHEAPAA